MAHKELKLCKYMNDNSTTVHILTSLKFLLVHSTATEENVPQTFSSSLLLQKGFQ